MKPLIQWAMATPGDRVEFESAQWPMLPSKPVPTGGETLDQQPGWVAELNVQGYGLRADHYHMEDLPDGSLKVTIWNDDAGDWDPEDFLAQEWIFHPLCPDARLGGMINTKQTFTTYVARSDRVWANVEGQTLADWKDFVPPTKNVLHGIWVEESLWEEHLKALGTVTWMDARNSEHLPEDCLDEHGCCKLGDPKVFYPSKHTRTFYMTTSASGHPVEVANVENSMVETSGQTGTISDTSVGTAGENSICFITDSGVPNVADWPNGEYRVSMNVTSATNCNYGVLTVGNGTGRFSVATAVSNRETFTQDESAFSGTGTRIGTNTIDPGSGAASDRFGCMIAAQNTSHGNTTLSIGAGANSFCDGPWTAPTITAEPGLIDDSSVLAPDIEYEVPIPLIDDSSILAPLMQYNVVMPLIADHSVLAHTAAFPLEPVLSKVGTFTVPGSTGNLDVTGFGFDDVAAVVYWGQTLTTNDSVANHASSFIGFAEVGGTSRCVLQSQNNSSDDCQRITRSNHCIYGTTGDAPTTLDFSATTVTAITDGMRINFDNVDGGAGFIIHYMAIGGEDVANVAIDNDVFSAGSVSGLGFEPDLLFGATVNYPTMNTFNGDGYLAFGAASNDGSESQFTTAAYGGRTGGSGNDNKMSLTEGDKFLRQMHGAYEIAITSFDAGGFTWSGSDGDSFIWLAIEFSGEKTAVGTYAKSTDAAPANDAGIPAFGFEPACLMLSTGCELSTAADADDNNYRLSLGASDGTTEGCTLQTGINLGNNKRQVTLNDRSIAISQELAAAGIEAEGSITLASSALVTWNPNDSQASEVGYIAIAQNTKLIASPPVIDDAQVLSPSGTQFMFNEDYGDLIFLIDIANPDAINARIADGRDTTCTWAHATETNITDYLMYDGVDATTGLARYRARLYPSGTGQWDLTTSGSVTELANLNGSFFVKAAEGTNPFKARRHLQKSTGDALHRWGNGDICTLGLTLGGSPAVDLDEYDAETISGDQLTFVEGGGSADTITRSAGSFIDDGWVAGMPCTITGTASNNQTVTLDPAVAVTATTLTLITADDLVDEGPVSCTIRGFNFVWPGNWNHVPSVAGSDPELGSVNTSQVTTDMDRLIGKDSDHGFLGFEIMIGGGFFNNGADSADPRGTPSGDPTISLQAFRALEYVIWESYKRGCATSIVIQFDEVDGNFSNFTGGYGGAEEQRLLDYIALRLGPIPGMRIRYGYDVWEFDGHSDPWDPPYPIEAEVEALVSRYASRSSYSVLIGARGHSGHLDDPIADAVDCWEIEGYKPGGSVSRSTASHYGYEEYFNYDPTGVPGPKPLFSCDQFRVRPQNSPSRHYNAGGAQGTPADQSAVTWKLLPYMFAAGAGAGGGVYADQTQDPLGTNGHPSRIKPFGRRSNYGAAPSNNYDNPTDFSGDVDERLRIRKIFGFFEWGEYHTPDRKYSTASVPRLGGIYTNYTEDGPTTESGTVCLENADGKYVLYVENDNEFRLTLDATGLNMTATEVPGIAMRVDADGEALGEYISLGTISRGSGEVVITLPATGYWLAELNVDFLTAEVPLIDDSQVLEPTLVSLLTASPDLIDDSQVLNPDIEYEVELDVIDDSQVLAPEIAYAVDPGLIDDSSVLAPTMEYHVIAPLIDDSAINVPDIQYNVLMPLIDDSQVIDPTAELASNLTAEPDLIDDSQVLAPDIEYQVPMPLIDDSQVLSPIMEYHVVVPLIDDSSILLPATIWIAEPATIADHSVLNPDIQYNILMPVIDDSQVIDPIAVSGIAAFPDVIDDSQVLNPDIQYNVLMPTIEDHSILAPIMEYHVVIPLIDDSQTLAPDIQYNVLMPLIDDSQILDPTADLLVNLTAEPDLIDDSQVLSPDVQYNVLMPVIDDSQVLDPLAVLGLAALPDVIDDSQVLAPGIKYQVTMPLVDDSSILAPGTVYIAEPGTIDDSAVLSPAIQYNVLMPLIDDSTVPAHVALLGEQFTPTSERIWTTLAKPRDWTALTKKRKWETL